ncbi:MAG: hypothetical protein GVY24_04765 [Planctomycetes bacterium]|nr:hypothetical protein [Planctomycetota bacterium]
MLNVLIIGGFLGAGKATRLARAARRPLASHKHVTVIDNQAGRTGAARPIVRRGGLAVGHSAERSTPRPPPSHPAVADLSRPGRSRTMLRPCRSRSIATSWASC